MQTDETTPQVQGPSRPRSSRFRERLASFPKVARTSTRDPSSRWRSHGLHGVALVGMDGAGKSTQISLLDQALTREGRRTVVIHPFGHKFLRLPGTLSLSKGLRQRCRKDGRGLLRTAVTVAELCDIGLYLWGAFVRYTISAAFRSDDLWVLSDRSFDDLLVKHRARGTLSWSAAARIRRLVPRFQQTIWLDVDPDVAARRDQEFDPSYYEALYTTYRTAATQFWWQRVPIADHSPAVILRVVQEVLRGCESSP